MGLDYLDAIWYIWGMIMNRHLQQLETYLTQLGLNAILADGKSKLYASVNCEDNFVLAVYHLAYDAILEEVCDFADQRDIEWFNAYCGTEHLTNTKFKAFVMNPCKMAYAKLRK